MILSARSGKQPLSCRTIRVWVLSAIMVLAGLSMLAGCKPPTVSPKPKAVIQVVAAENFYGSVAGQIGGERVQVVSIMSDPNVDPHEYEADPKDAVAIAKSNLVIENGLDYDNWMPRLLAASPNASRIVLTAGKLAPEVLEENPHVWYSLKNMRAIASAICEAYKKLDPGDAAEFDKNLETFDSSLQPVESEMEAISKQFAGTPVGLTETIFLYQTGPMKLKVLTPWPFQHAIAEGNDPPVASIATTNTQVTGHEIKVLIYNVQTITPITTHLQEEAKKVGIPVVGVSETMPRDDSYQSWMLKELQGLEAGLKDSVK